jgi:hypothetical protein
LFRIPGRRLVAAAAAGFSLLFGGYSHAAPQYSAGLVTGVCGTGSDGSLWQDTCWFNGARAELVLGRSRSSDFGAGPFLDATSAGFEDVRLGGGLIGVAPFSDSLPIALSLGGYARRDDDRWFPGLAGWLFIGSRSYNFHSNYAIAAGLLVGYQRDLHERGSDAIVIALQLDALLLAIPGIYAASALRGSPEE